MVKIVSRPAQSQQGLQICPSSSAVLTSKQDKLKPIGLITASKEGVVNSLKADKEKKQRAHIMR